MNGQKAWCLYISLLSDGQQASDNPDILQWTKCPHAVSISGEMFYTRIFMCSVLSNRTSAQKYVLNRLNNIKFRPSIDDKICDSLNHVGLRHMHQYHLLLILNLA